MLLQAMDYLHLYRDHDCALRVGGSDQWEILPPDSISSAGWKGPKAMRMV